MTAKSLIYKGSNSEKLPLPTFVYSDGTLNHPVHKPRRRKTTCCTCVAISLITVLAFLAVGVLIYWGIIPCPWSSATQYGDSYGAGAKQGNPFSFDDIFDSQYRYRGFGASWKSDADTFVYRNASTGDLMVYDAATDVQILLMSNQIFVDVGAGSWWVNNDRTFVLLAYDVKQVFRHSRRSKYKIYDITAQNVLDFPASAELQNQDLQLAVWSTVSDHLAFVYEYNVYYQATPTAAPVQVTTDGRDVYVWNGIPDWLYEEDVIGTNRALWFSPSSQYLVYARFDDTEVPLIQFPWYGPKSDMYGSTVDIAYPKAGYLTESGQPGPNTQAQLFVIRTSQPSGQRDEILPPAAFVGQDYYFTQVTWVDAHFVMVGWANRVQNHTIYTICDVRTMVCVNNREEIVSGGWNEVPGQRPIFTDANTYYVTILPRSEGAAGNFRQVAYLQADENASPQFLTTGQMDVISLAGFEAERNILYYISTNGNPNDRHLYRVGTPTADPQFQTPECLTCGVSTDCEYVSASLSASGRYYVQICSGPAIPTYSLKSGIDTSKNVMLEDNADVWARLSQKDLPTREFMDINIGDGYVGQAEIFLPPGYTPGKQYPLLVYTYAGPGSQRVNKRFPIAGNTNSWLTYLKSSHEVVVASIDGRGSAARGDKFMYEIYRRLGTVEVEDQIIAGEYFKSLDYVDSSLQAAAFGWSYGGQTSSHIVGNESTTFQCGIAVAPVSSKKYYDTAYTERYMGLATKDDNQAGYNTTEVLWKAPNFANKTYLIAHGTADDNVHYQHAAQMIRALQDAEVQFKMMMYVDDNHNINTRYSSRHLYRLMTNFLLEDCWGRSPTKR